jgi:hypothetical protein
MQLAFAVRDRAMKLTTAGWMILGALITGVIYAFMVAILKYA